MKNAIYLVMIGAIAIALATCTKPTNSPVSTGTSTNTDVVTGADCGLVQEKLNLRNQIAELPTQGRFVLESHLVTKEDPAGYPATVAMNIQQHLNRTCQALQKYGAKSDCSDVYTLTYHKQWTPAEKGKIGQGSIGEMRPSAEQEMWSFNMYWTEENKPKPGTKYLLSYNGRNVVAVGGFETGPMSAEFLGGVQGEIHWALKSDSDAQVRIGRLKDQSLSLGLTVCK